MMIDETRAQLVEIGKKLEIVVPSRAKKEDMVKMIEEKTGIPSISSVILSDYFKPNGFIAQNGTDFTPRDLENHIIDFNRDLRESEHRSSDWTASRRIKEERPRPLL